MQHCGNCLFSCKAKPSIPWLLYCLMSIMLIPILMPWQALDEDYVQVNSGDNQIIWHESGLLGLSADHILCQLYLIWKIILSVRDQVLCVESWRCHQMETFSALLALCAGNLLVTGEFPTQKPMTRSFDAFFDLYLNKWLSKHLWGWWFETLLCSLWCHCNDGVPVWQISWGPVSNMYKL